MTERVTAEKVLASADALRWEAGANLHDSLMESIYADAGRIADRTVTRRDEKPRFQLDRTIDGLVTSRWLGFPLMLLMLAVVFWLTIEGANTPSRMLATLLIDDTHPLLKGLAATLGLPWWLDGLLIDGMYLAMAWVIAVMLPPMAIFFPLFTLLEDFGYLPRVAFNLDNLFKKSGAHGKQALTMAMGFGCNAAAIVSTRVIDSPRERLIAIITNNFALCNGRWPTQILIASIFIGGLVPAHWAGLVSAGAVVSVAVLGIVLSFVVSWGLSHTILKGEASAFSLELPPYRPPRILRTIYTSIIDRTLIVLWRAVVFAIPAGAAIWLASKYPHRWRQHCRGVHLQQHPLRAVDRPQWRHPVGLHRRHPGQRDRHPHHSDADRVERQDGRIRRGRRRHVRTGFGDRYRRYSLSRRLDPAHGREPDALQSGPQSVLNHAVHDIQRNEECEVDGDFRSASCCHGLRTLLLCYADMVSGCRGMRA